MRNNSYRASLFLGNLFEHYDTALYSFLSPLFATLFFSQENYVHALIYTLSFIPLGKLSKPLGAAVFGYIGDVRGRGEALYYSLMGMAVTTLIIAFLPTYGRVGALAPLLFFVLRLFQNFFAAGEHIGGAIGLLENCSTDEEKDMASSYWGASTIGGILLASVAATILYMFDGVTNGWRALYLVGSATALFGAVIRSKNVINEKIPFSMKHFLSRFTHVWQMRSAALAIAIASGFSYATYALSFTLMTSFIPLISNLSKKEVMLSNTYLLILDFILLPIFGKLGTILSRSTSMILSAIATLIVSIPIAFLLKEPTLSMVLMARILIVTVGVWFSATFHSWAQNMVPKEFRYSAISISYALGSQMLGGIAPALSLWIYSQTGAISSITWYWSLLAVATAISIARTKPQLELSPVIVRR